jgi:hypothetical protein
MAINLPIDPTPSGPARPGRLWARLHFLVRFLGLTGALALGVGLVLGSAHHLLGSWADFRSALEGRAGPGFLAALLTAVGAGCLLFALLVEALVVLFFAAGRRSAFGFNALLQAALALVLLVGVNLYSAGFSVPVPDFLASWLGDRIVSNGRIESKGHYARIDCTRGRSFTLPADLREQLARLDRERETTVVVYQQHKTFGARPDKPDRYDYAAERKVVEKVKDLVSQLREIGPQLRVEVLDVEAEGYDDKLKALKEKSPALYKAVVDAPENSIFICAGDDVQRLGFNEFYQLDKVSSEKDNGGRGNLVLLGQGEDGRGVRPFVRKIVNLEQRRPRIGVLVIHELLTTEGSEDVFTLAGLRKALEAHGFDVRDVVLKKGWEGRAPLSPAADTFEETKLERLDAEVEGLEDDIRELVRREKAQAQAVDDVKEKRGEDTRKKLAELSRRFGSLFDGSVTAEDRPVLQRWLEGGLKAMREELAENRKELAAKRKERDKLDLDRIYEAQRMSDVKAKLTYALADCDLLLVPRITRRDNGQVITPNLHNMSAEQAQCIKAFLAAGKPVLACLGPTNEPPRPFEPPDRKPAEPDDFEKLFDQLRIRLGKQTVLFSSDARAFAERRSDFLRSAEGKAPPLDFDSPTGEAGYPKLTRKASRTVKPNPLREGLRVTARSVGKEFGLRLRFPRPIYYEPLRGRGPDYDPTFLLTATGWNDDQPFATRDRRPRYTPPPSNDPAAGTINARRRGPFPVGVAVEVSVPGWWDKKADTVRVAVIGQGDVFVGNQFSPARERLALQTINWLLGRDDYLPSADHPWRYPRIDLPPESADHALWLWATRLGLPALFAYLGLVVLLMRRLR